MVFLVGDLALFAVPAIGLTFIPTQVAKYAPNTRIIQLK